VPSRSADLPAGLSAGEAVRKVSLRAFHCKPGCCKPTVGPLAYDERTPVTEAYKSPFRFTGKIAKVTVELKETKAAEDEVDSGGLLET
jgi:hypothetical protein